jgi:hypothetical protein
MKLGIYVCYGNWSHLYGILHKSFPPVCVSACVSLPSLLGNGWINTFPRRRIHATIEELLDAWFSMRSMSYKRSQWVCLLSLLRNNSVNTLPWQRIIVGGVFYAVHVASKENRRLILPRTSCFIHSRWTLNVTPQAHEFANFVRTKFPLFIRIPLPEVLCESFFTVICRWNYYAFSLTMYA